MIPNRFYYCVPELMVKENEIPDYSGLIYVNTKGEFKIIKEAPLLHMEKLNPVKMFNKTYSKYIQSKKIDLR